MNPTVTTRGWRDRLKDAIENEVRLGQPEWDALMDLALTWEHCAVGENREQLKQKGYTFGKNKHPTDPASTLYDAASPFGRKSKHTELGLKFTNAIGDAHWDTALEILDQIENLPTL